MKIPSPAFPEPLRPSDDLLLEIDIAADNEDDLENFLFEKMTCTALEARKLEFHHCQFRTCRLLDAVLNRCYFADVRFENCDLSGADFSDSTFHRVVFDNCRLTGMDLNDSIFENCRFYLCQGEMSNFASCKANTLSFEQCVLSDSRLEACRLKNTAFTDCRLEGCELLHTALKNMDLRSDQITGIRLSGRRELNGAIVTPEQAADLAALLGVIVRS